MIIFKKNEKVTIESLLFESKRRDSKKFLDVQLFVPADLKAEPSLLLEYGRLGPNPGPT